MSDLGSVFLFGGLHFGFFGLFERIHAECVAAIHTEVSRRVTRVFFSVCSLRESFTDGSKRTTVNRFVHSEQIMNSPTAFNLSPDLISAGVDGASRSSELIEEARARFLGG